MFHPLRPVWSILLALACAVPTACLQPRSTSRLPDTATVQRATSLQTHIASIDPYGSLTLACSSGALLDAGFLPGDLVQIALGPDRVLSMPLLPHYRLVAPGDPVLVAWSDSTRPARIAIFYGNAASRYSVGTQQADASWTLSQEIPLRITLQTRGVYSANLDLLKLQRSTQRSDYPELSDWDYANFRAVSAPLLASNRLYRASSPFHPELGRHTYVDDACREVGIRSIVNMTSSREKTPLSKDTYCASQTILFRPMSVDTSSPAYEADLADCFRFLATHTSPTLLHCTEGQDRTGFACAILQAFFGATLDDITSDYLQTFRNYYRLPPKSPSETALRRTLLRLLERAFGPPLPQNNLQNAAHNYLLHIGLTPSEILSLQSTLSDFSPQ